jgi:CheY-like chemotaxis protein
MSITRVYYIDDSKEEAERTKLILEASDKLEVVVEQPTTDIGAAISAELPDLFLVDYALDARQDNGTYANYKGDTLAAAIREKAPDYPVVLITRESIVDSRRKQELEREFPLVNYILYKSELHEDHDRVVDDLVNIAAGFQSLRQIASGQRDWDRLLQVLQATPEESALLRRAAPPLYAGPGSGGSVWAVSEIADWIRDVIVKYPGILYDRVFAATELGISVDDFLLPEVQELFTRANYSGIFAPPQGRWWRERLWQIAMEYVEDGQFADKFARVFTERTGKELRPSKSIVRGEEPADTVCYIYHKPVMYKYTVAYRPDNRPSVMDPARVSFKAIQQSGQVQWALIEGVSDELLERIKEMEL